MMVKGLAGMRKGVWCDSTGAGADGVRLGRPKDCACEYVYAVQVAQGNQLEIVLALVVEEEAIANLTITTPDCTRAECSAIAEAMNAVGIRNILAIPPANRPKL